jgi:hypothetical protein
MHDLEGIFEPLPARRLTQRPGACEKPSLRPQDADHPQSAGDKQ